jgi:hypothetical protein
MAPRHDIWFGQTADGRWTYRCTCGRTGYSTRRVFAEQYLREHMEAVTGDEERDGQR